MWWEVLQRQADGSSFESVAGSALIHTGADVTAFDLAAAARAGLAHCGAKSCTGSGRGRRWRSSAKGTAGRFGRGQARWRQAQRSACQRATCGGS